MISVFHPNKMFLNFTLNFLYEHGGSRAKETHQLAEANEAKNRQLRAAFGISEFYVDGSSLDPSRKAKEEAARTLAMATKEYK